MPNAGLSKLELDFNVAYNAGLPERSTLKLVSRIKMPARGRQCEIAWGFLSHLVG